jgi:hypothetical protein
MIGQYRCNFYMVTITLLISGGYYNGSYAGGFKFGIFDADAAADRMSIDSSANVTFNDR